MGCVGPRSTSYHHPGRKRFDVVGYTADFHYIYTGLEEEDSVMLEKPQLKRTFRERAIVRTSSASDDGKTVTESKN